MKNKMTESENKKDILEDALSAKSNAAYQSYLNSKKELETIFKDVHKKKDITIVMDANLQLNFMGL